MVEFNGKCCEEVVIQTKRMNIADKNSVRVKKKELTVLIIFLMFFIPLCYLLIYCMRYFAFEPPGWGKVGALFGIFFALPTTFGFFAASIYMTTKTFYTHKNYILWDYYIKITNNTVDWRMYNRNGYIEVIAKTPLFKIAKVVETDICYYIYVNDNAGKLKNVIVCDKSTLTEGSLEEFNQTFKEKITVQK